MIWTESILDQFAADGLIDITNQIDCIFHRFYLATTKSTATYTLPAFCKTVTRITWRNQKVDPISWLGLQDLMYRNEAIGDPYSIGRPRYYAHYPNNARTIMFYPTPNESLLDSVGDPFKPTSNEAVCIISCWRYPDDTNPLFTIPAYIARRTLKAFVLWKAFGKEGKGQNLKASSFYSQMYTFLIGYFKLINDGVYMSTIYSLSDKVGGRNSRPSKPRLPSQFGDVFYR